MKFSLLLIASVLQLTTFAARAQTCSNADGVKGEEAVDHLNSWSDVRAAFVRYAPQCDNGGVAEGFGDRVVHLLATRWRSLYELDEMMIKDDAFRKFVLRHIYATAYTDELRAIAQHSQSCLKKDRPLCKQLNRAALEAIDEEEKAEQG